MNVTPNETGDWRAPGGLRARRFTDEEVSRIFQQAAAAGTLRGSDSDGEEHTLEDLHAIAEEVGIDRAAIDRAAAEIIAADASAPRPRRFWRFSSLLHEDAVIPRALRNDEMRNLAIQIEPIIGRRGLLSDTAAWVEWRDVKSRPYIGFVRGEQTTRVRAITNYSGEIGFGAGLIALIGAVMVPATSEGGVFGIFAGLAGTLALFGFFVRWRAKVNRGHLPELLDILTDTSSRLRIGLPWRSVC